MKRRQVLTGLVVTLVLGLMLGLETHIDHTTSTNSMGSYLAQSQALTAAMQLSPKLQRRLTRDERQLQALQATASNISHGLSMMRQELASLQKNAGLTPLQGPGLVITINYDPNLPVIPSLRYVDEAEQLQMVINLLAAGHAEGFAINGQRLVTTTSIRSVNGLSAPAGPFSGTVQVGGVPVVAPYTIRVVGPVQSLDNMLQVEAIAQQFAILDQSFVVQAHEKHKGVSLPAYDGALPFSYITEVGA